MKLFRALFAWKTVRDDGIYAYQQNTVTGRRRVVGGVSGGYVPVDRTWLETGRWHVPTPPSDFTSSASRA